MVKAARESKSPTEQPSKRSAFVFAIAAVALMMASIDQMIVATALGDIQAGLGARLNWSIWTITIYFLGQIVAMPVTGALSDQLGRRRVFLGALVIFTASSLACGLATNIQTLVALRFVQALGGGAFIPSATGIVSDEFGDNRDRAIGLFTSIFPVGGLIGPVLGGILVSVSSWRMIFLVNVPVGLLVIVGAWILIPKRTGNRDGMIDVRGCGLLVCTLLMSMVAVSHLGEDAASPRDPVFLATGLAGLACLAAFVVHTRGNPEALIPPTLLVGRGFLVMNVINFFFGVALFGLAALVPIYAQLRYGLSPLQSGTLLTGRAIGMIAVAGLAAMAIRRTGVRRPMTVGFAITAVGLAGLAVSPHGLSPFVWLGLATTVTGLGMGASQPASNVALLQIAPGRAAGITGLRGMFRQAGGITAVSIIASISARSPVPAVAQAHGFAAFAVVLFALLILVRRVPEYHPR